MPSLTMLVRSIMMERCARSWYTLYLVVQAWAKERDRVVRNVRQIFERYRHAGPRTRKYLREVIKVWLFQWRNISSIGGVCQRARVDVGCEMRRFSAFEMLLCLSLFFYNRTVYPSISWVQTIFKVFLLFNLQILLQLNPTSNTFLNPAILNFYNLTFNQFCNLNFK